MIEDELGTVLPAEVPADPPRKRRGLLIVALAVVVVLVAAAGGYWFLARDRADDVAATPSRWDSRVTTLVSFVETHRGLKFKHPVAVQFLPVPEFKKEFAADEKPDAEEQAELDRVVGELRALGLVSGDVKLDEAAQTMGEEGVIGLYQPHEQRVLVRGAELTVGVKVTLAHELTHALEDQYFDLEKLEDTETSGASFAHRALIEASASRIEDEYLSSLLASEREAYFAEQDKARDEAGAAKWEALPDLLTDAFAMPYVLGPTFLQQVIGDAKGAAANRAVDRAFRRPPASEEHIVEPGTYLDKNLVIDVAPPKLAKGETRTADDDDFGMLSLAMTLEPVVGFDQAWKAVTGWSGDATSHFRRGGKKEPCVRVAVRFDTSGDRDEFVDVAGAWAKERTANRAAVSSTGKDGATLTACDPGSGGAAVPDGRHPSLLEDLALRNEITRQFREGGFEADDAQCMVDGLFTKLGMQRVYELDRSMTAATEEQPAAAATEEIQSAVQAVAGTCGVGLG